MQLGAMVFPTDQTMPPDELAAEVEARGFGSLLVPEHTHIPLDHSPYPAGGELPDMYRRCLDPFVVLTAAAAATTDLRIGTGVCLAAQHDPIVLAKQVASLDHLSGGRFVFGVGFGWNAPEAAHHGVAFGDRRAVVREHVLTMRALWRDEVAAFSGDHVRLGPSWAWPKPVQRPHPPVLVGARLGPRTVADVTEWGDGWLPMGGSGLRDAIPHLRTAFQEAGRDPDGLTVWVTGSKPDVDQLRYFARLGVEHTSFWLPSGQRHELLPVLDRYAAVREELAA